MRPAMHDKIADRYTFSYTIIEKLSTRMNKWLIFISMLPLSSFSFAHSDFDTELRSECAKVKSYANSGKKFYDQKQYQSALGQFQQQAAWSAFCQMHNGNSGVAFSEHAIATAFNNVGLSYFKLGKPQWARVWFSVYPDAKNSRFNLKQLPFPQKNPNLTGIYVQYAGFGHWNRIEIKRTKSAYQIQFNGLYMGLNSLIYGPNMGSFETAMPFNQTQATYKVDECKIDLAFKFDPKAGQQAILKQNSGGSGCGFGHNVSANGVYLKVE